MCALWVSVIRDQNLLVSDKDKVDRLQIIVVAKNYIYVL